LYRIIRITADRISPVVRPCKYDGVLPLPMPVARRCTLRTLRTKSPISRGSEVSHEQRIAHNSPLFLYQNRIALYWSAVHGRREDSHAVRGPAVGWPPKRGRIGKEADVEKKREEINR